MVEMFGLTIDAVWLWLAAGLALLLLELATGSLFLLWPAMAALGFAAIVYFAPTLAPAIQLTGFALLTVLLTIAGRSYFRAHPTHRGGDRPMLNDRAAQLVGRRVAALEAFEDGFGAVRLDDGQWRARLAEGAASGGSVAAGAALRVVAVEGATLVVEPA